MAPDDAAPDPYRPLRLTRQHLDALEGYWIRAQAAAFATRGPVPPGSAEEAIRRHLLGLGMRADEALHEASFRVGSSRYGEAYAAARVLAELAPGDCLDARGRVRLRTTNRLAVARALADSGIVCSAAIDDPTSVLAAAFVGDVPPGVLLAHLTARQPAVGLLAAAFRSSVDRPLSRVVESLLAGGSRDEQALAILAFSRAAMFAGPGRAALGSALDALLPHEVYVCAPDDPRVLALAVVGDARAARRIATASEGAMTPTAAWALGVLGVPAWSGDLLPALSSREALAREALRALYHITGCLFVRGPAREDGVDLTADPEAARAFLSTWPEAPRRERFHLGVPLASADRATHGPPSAGFLRLPVKELLPGLSPERPKRSAGFFDLLAPTAPVVRRRPTSTGPSLEHLRERARAT